MSDLFSAEAPQFVLRACTRLCMQLLLQFGYFGIPALYHSDTHVNYISAENC